MILVSEKENYLVKVAADEIKELVHQFRFLHFRDIDNCKQKSRVHRKW